MDLSKQKTLGNISPDQFARTLALMDWMDSWADVFALIRQQPRFKKLTEDPRVGFTWASAYELEYKFMLNVLLLTIADATDLANFAGADDKVEYMLGQA